MTRSQRGAAVAIVAAVALLCVGALAVVAREGTAVRYHLWKLRNKPHYLAEILEEPEGSPKKAAIRKFVEEPAGKMHLLRTYVNEVREEFDEFSLQVQRLSANASTSGVWFSFGEDIFLLGPGRSDGSLEVREYECSNTRRYRIPQRLVADAGYSKYRLSDEPGLAFSVLTLGLSEEAREHGLSKTWCRIEKISETPK